MALTANWFRKVRAGERPGTGKRVSDSLWLPRPSALTPRLGPLLCLSGFLRLFLSHATCKERRVEAFLRAHWRALPEMDVGEAFRNPP